MHSKVELKAGVLRGYVRWLHDHGAFDDVRRRVTPDVRALLDDPPVPTMWLEAEHATLPLVEALASARELGTVRRMSREATRSSVFPLLRPILEGIVRLTTGPSGVVERLPILLKSSTRGIEYEVDVSEREALLVLTSSHLLETRPSGEAWAGAIEAALEIAGVAPTVDVSAILASPELSRLHFSIRW